MHRTLVILSKAKNPGYRGLAEPNSFAELGVRGSRHGLENS